MKKSTFLIVILFFVSSLTAQNDFLKSFQSNNSKLSESIFIFYRQDCSYCQQMDKLLSNDIDIQQKTKEKFNVKVVDINSEEGKQIAQLYNVNAVPTIIKFGKELGSFTILKGYGSNARFSNFLGLELKIESLPFVNSGIPPMCGNGIVDVLEQCDDANTNNGDGCNSICNVESGFICTGSPSVCTTNVVCGNGLVESGEQCDDANTTNGDGCNAICNVEPGFICTGSPSVCVSAICGNGLVESGEQCDDANTTNGDGCNAICNVEPGFICTGSPSICVSAICGNGLVESGEQCDDANTTNGDGCNATCNVESGFSCTGSPSVCNVLGLEDNVSQFVALKIYPNPFKSFIEIDVNLKETSEIEIAIIDSRGKLIDVIKKTNLVFGENEVLMNVDNSLQAGLYFVKVQIINENGIFYETKKIIKE